MDDGKVEERPPVYPSQKSIHPSLFPALAKGIFSKLASH